MFPRHRAVLGLVLQQQRARLAPAPNVVVLVLRHMQLQYCILVYSSSAVLTATTNLPAVMMHCSFQACTLYTVLLYCTLVARDTLDAQYCELLINPMPLYNVKQDTQYCR